MRFALIAALLATVAVPAGAVTLTFDGIPDATEPRPLVATEQGVTMTADPSSDGLVYDVNPGTLHFDDAGTVNPSFVDFTTGGTFSARSIDVFPLTMSTFVSDESSPDPDEWQIIAVPYDNLFVQGFLNGTETASLLYSTGLGSDLLSFDFGNAFASIDRLRITVISPFGQSWNGLPISCTNAPCGHFELDSLTLAPVPLPAGLPLIAAGVGALALLRRRR